MHAQSGKSDLDDPFKELESKKWRSPCSPGTVPWRFPNRGFVTQIFYWVAFNSMQLTEIKLSQGMFDDICRLVGTTWFHQSWDSVPSAMCHIPKMHEHHVYFLRSTWFHDLGTQSTYQRSFSILPATGPQTASHQLDDIASSFSQGTQLILWRMSRRRCGAMSTQSIPTWRSCVPYESAAAFSWC